LKTGSLISLRFVLDSDFVVWHLAPLNGRRIGRLARNLYVFEPRPKDRHPEALDTITPSSLGYIR